MQHDNIELPISLIYSEVPIGQVLLDPELLPDCLELSSSKKRQSVLEQRLEALFLATGYYDPLKVAPTDDGRFALIDNYPLLRFLQKAHSDNPTVRVRALVFSCTSREHLKRTAFQIQAALNGVPNHIQRLLQIRLMLASSLSPRDIRRAFGCLKARSSEGKQIERDIRIASQDKLYQMVTGAEPGSSLPQVDLARLSYSQGLLIEKILIEEPSCWEIFESRYNSYLKQVREHLAYEDEISKPIFEWKKFDIGIVKNIAFSAVSSFTGQDSSDLILANSQFSDQTWRISIDLESGKVNVPSISFNISALTDPNIKTIVEIVSKGEALVHSLESHLRKIAPVNHGGKARVQDVDLAAYIHVPSNTPRFEDLRYFDFIRGKRLLAYCNKHRLLASIGLKPPCLGFSSGQDSSCSTYEASFKAFDLWYREDFLKSVIEFCGGDTERHPFYSIYIELRAILLSLSKDSRSTRFDQLLMTVFSEVFNFLDRRDERSKKDATQFSNLKRSARIEFWEELNRALKKGEITEEEITTNLANFLTPHSETILNRLTILRRQVSEITESP